MQCGAELAVPRPLLLVQGGGRGKKQCWERHWNIAGQERWQDKETRGKVKDFKCLAAVSRVQPTPAAQVSRTERLGDLIFCKNFIWHHRIDDCIVLPGLAVSTFCNVNLYSMTQDVMKGF